MITTIVIVVFVILVVAYFMGRDEEEAPDEKVNSSPQKIPAKPKQVFEVVKIDNPTLSIPESESIPDQEVESYSDENTTYNVSVSEMTCTCPDFKKHRKGVPVNDPRRACKHLYCVLEENNLLSNLSELALAILESPSKNKKLTTVKLSSGNEVSICHGGNEWVDVFTRKRRKGDSGGLYSGKYDRFGFNINEQRWSYGDGPPGAREIKSILSQVL
ncbi:hypothetical protein [Halioxenophilus sp. WMMB6]|uniref:hypothetical protein n=1 Tax=Halioxenophilus sp. WMMB6 TaxID=3073815 RepID=UPI00295E2C40|nr:hypothetical protein [Halioxenophilus sp. WMMB6]